MSVILIQIQPRLAPQIDLALVREVARQVGPATLFGSRGEEEGFDNGPYISLYFDAHSLSEAWPIIRSQLYGDARFGALLKGSSIAVCEGNDPWNDYLLLHHFDPSEALTCPG